MTQADFPTVYEIVKSTGSLDVHTPYTYWVMLKQSSDLMLVCERNAQIVGFVAGLAPFREPAEALVWQIGVRPALQRRGVGTELLQAFTNAAIGRGVSLVCTTITKTNSASLQLFTSFAGKLGTRLETEEETGTMGGLMREELIYRIAVA